MQGFEGMQLAAKAIRRRHTCENRSAQRKRRRAQHLCFIREAPMPSFGARHKLSAIMSSGRGAVASRVLNSCCPHPEQCSKSECFKSHLASNLIDVIRGGHGADSRFGRQDEIHLYSSFPLVFRRSAARIQPCFHNRI